LSKIGDNVFLIIGLLYIVGVGRNVEV